MKKITIICTSTGKNLELGLEIEKYLVEQKGAKVELLNVVELELPLYSTKAEAQGISAEALVTPFKEKLNADAFIFLSPEYNGGTAPAFNNFMAWVSRSTKNWRDSFNGKPALLASFSAGSSTQVIAIMRIQLAHIGMNVIGRSIQSTMGKAHRPEDIQNSCDALLRFH